MNQLFEVSTFDGRRAGRLNNDAYQSQLNAFLLENDLLNGKAFNEASLPARQALSQRATTEQSAATPKPRSQRPASPSAASSQGAVVGSPTTSGRQHSTRTSTERSLNVEATTEQLNHAASVSTKIAPLPTVEEHKPRAGLDGAEKRNGSQEDASKLFDTVHVQGVPRLEPSTESHDAQSSPTSSRGRPTSHTPGPDATSPTTSPGDDQEPTLELLGMKPPDFFGEEPPTPITSVPMRHKMSVSSIDVDMIDVDPTTAFGSPLQPSKHPPENELAESRTKATGTEQNLQDGSESYFDAPQDRSQLEISRTLVQSPAGEIPMTTPAIDPSRRATRIQSGALLKKSVSEILGEMPRPASPNIESPASVRTAEKSRKDRERARLSTVVFAKNPKMATEITDASLTTQGQSPKTLAKAAERDYMYTLFESKAHSQSRAGSLAYLLQHSHKTISTSEHLVDYQYQAHCRVLKRLYQLQNADKWSLRQRKRAEEPARPTSHWDFLLDHTKWLRTDFREERRWKLVAARALAEACAEWVAAPPADRKALQVTVRSPSSSQVHDPGQDADEHMALSPPELEANDEDDSMSEDLADPRDTLISVPPAAIFSLGASEFTFATEKTPAFDELLGELPLYEPAKIEPDLAKSNLAEKLDAKWKLDIVPISKYTTEKLKVKEYGPPLKRSRYDYDVDDSALPTRQTLAPRETEVALFMAENKHIRDRIHPGHAFRPPAEHPMPSQAFFEARGSSQWLAAEDDEVRRQAREYSFNWTLISELMTSPTLYTSGQERRTAWECFERWIGLEGMPADMAKTPYFKTYSNRIETAQRNVQAQWEEHERRNNPVPSGRRKTTLPVRVERKHNRRHLFMLDAMRKLAKKREAFRQKQMQSADLAAMRKSNDIHAPRPGFKTPAEWSQLKFEREQKMAKQQEMYKQQLIAHQRAVVQQQRAGQPNQANGVPIAQNAGGQMRVPGPNGMPVPGMPNGQLHGANGQTRPHPNMMGMAGGMNGMPNGMAGPKNMVQQGPGVARGVALSPQQAKMQQEILRQTQLAQQGVTHSSPNVAQASLANGSGINSAHLNALAQANNQASPSPARPQPMHTPQSLSGGSVPKVNQLLAAVREQNPNATDEEISNMATRQLLQYQRQATAAAAGATNAPPKVNQAALNAALGAANSSAYAATQNRNAMNLNANMPAQPNMQHPQMSYAAAQQYHERIRLQTQQAQNAARGIYGPGPIGMTASPVMNIARPVSQHSQHSTMNGTIGRSSVTPARDQRSGSVSANVNNAQGQMNGAQPGTPGTGVVPQTQGSPFNATTPMQT